MTTVNANFNKILIIQSLNDYLTGNKLQDDLNVLTIFTNGIVSSELLDAKDKKTFLSTLLTIKNNVLKGKYNPIIHIEAHGNPDCNGLILASGESITWQELKIPLAEINEATRLNLVVCIAACYGGSLAKVLGTQDRAPCWALVGPKEEMYPNDLLKDYTGFYEEIFKTQSGGMALKRLNRNLVENEAKYFFTTAECLFERVWINYLEKECSKENLDKRANKISKELKKNSMQYLPSRNQIKKDIIKIHPSSFKKSKDKFFMIDLFQENKVRFLVDYNNILLQAKT